MIREMMRLLDSRGIGPALVIPVSIRTRPFLLATVLASDYLSEERQRVNVHVYLENVQLVRISKHVVAVGHSFQ